MIIQAVDHGNGFDFGKTSRIYAQFRDIYPPQLYEKLRTLGIGKAGTCWLDVGTGTGVLPLNLYTDRAKIIGADISAEQIAAAKEIAAQKNAKIKWIVSPAETLPIPDASVDFVTAAQCFWYFDRERFLAELRRVLKPGGTFVKIYLTYSLRDPIARRSYQMIKRMNPDWMPGSTGYRDVYTHPFPNGTVDALNCLIPFTRESWHGRMCACRGTMASMDAETFRLWDERHRRMLQKFPQTFTVRHRLYIASYRMN